MDRAAWQATVHAVKRSQTRLITHTHPTTHTFERITTSLQGTYFSSDGTAGTFLQKIGRKPQLGETEVSKPAKQSASWCVWASFPSTPVSRFLTLKGNFLGLHGPAMENQTFLCGGGSTFSLGPVIFVCFCQRLGGICPAYARQELAHCQFTLSCVIQRAIISLLPKYTSACFSVSPAIP